MKELGPALSQSFHLAAGELGMATAAWLFAREVAAEAGDSGVGELRDLLGREFPVVDAVAQQWSEGRRAPSVHVSGVLAACANASQILVVGLETAFLDVLVPALSLPRVHLLAHGELETDWTRVAANYGDRIELCTLSSFQALAGRRSVLLSFAYGGNAHSTFVGSSWLRVAGPDVRTQFRDLVAWDVLGSGLYVYPRWLHPVPRADFTHVVS